MMLKVYLDGNFHTNVASPDELQQQADFAGVDVSRLSIPADELDAYFALQTRKWVRKEIEPLAGDTQSIQGTIADNVGYLLEKIGRLAAANSISQTAFNTVMAEIASDLAPLVAGIDGGSITLTHHVKGVNTIITEAGERATAVATVLQVNAT